MEMNTKRDSSRFTDRNLVIGSGIKKRKKKSKLHKQVISGPAVKDANKQSSFYSEKSKKDVDDVVDVAQKEGQEGETPDGEN